MLVLFFPDLSEYLWIANCSNGDPCPSWLTLRRSPGENVKPRTIACCIARFAKRRKQRRFRLRFGSVSGKCMIELSRLHTDYARRSISLRNRNGGVPSEALVCKSIDSAWLRWQTRFSQHSFHCMRIADTRHSKRCKQRFQRSYNIILYRCSNTITKTREKPTCIHPHETDWDYVISDVAYHYEDKVTQHPSYMRLFIRIIQIDPSNDSCMRNESPVCQIC